MKYIHTLTGLRGLAALIVFISHSANESLLPIFFGKGFGQIGVMIFFVLSGFLMSHLYISENFNLLNIRRYFVARAGRVIPLYFALILLSFLISKYLDNDFYYNFNDINLVSHAILFIDAPYVFWTIPVEIQFYIIFVIYWYIYKNKSSPYFLVFFILLTMTPTVIIYLTLKKLPVFISLYSYAFFIGVITSHLQEKIKHNNLICRITPQAGYPIIILLFINLPYLRDQYGLIYYDHYFLKTWGDPISWLLVYSLFILSILNVPSISFLNHKFFVSLGNISFGFYLIHYPILLFYKEIEIHPWLQLLLSFLSTIFIASLSYKYFEKPMNKKVRYHLLKK